MRNVIFFFCCLFLNLVVGVRLAVAQSDQMEQNIAAFWKETRSQLDQVPIDAKVSPITDAIPYHTYKITLQSLGNVKIVALLALPIQGEEKIIKPWPVIISNPGYGGKQQSVMLSECQRGYAILQVFPRGQGESEPYYKIKGDKLTGQLSNPDSNYYRGAYADVIRVIDYVFTRKDLDANRIALVGTSQAGGISLAVGSIDRRVKTVVAHVPFLSNFELAAKTDGSLVKQLLDKAGKNNVNSYATLAYFDPLNLVNNLRVPTLVSAGGEDTTCPKATIKSVYTNITGKKEFKFYPNLKHTSCLDFYNQGWSWIYQNL